MTGVPLSYDELLARLGDAEEMIRSLALQQADAVVSHSGVHLLRLHETDHALQVAKQHLETMLAQRTQELERANQSLMREVAEREAAQRRLATVIESAMDAIITADPQMNVVIFNSAAEKIFDCSAAEALGRPVTAFLPGYKAALLQKGIQAEARNPEGETPRLLEGIRASGETFPVEAAISRVGDGSENLYTLVVRDISLRQQTEAALVRSEKLATVGRLAATLAHEINNPLAAISDILYLLRDDVTSEGAKRYLSMAEMEVRRAAQIAQNTLGLARQFSTPERFRIAELVDGVLVLLESRVQEKGVRVSRRYAPDKLEIVAVAGEIRQVLWNLLTNALDAVSARTGQIEVRITGTRGSAPGENACVRITVADNGAGMRRETLQRVLEPFYTTKSQGTGLGLWITSEIIRKHAGSMQVRSRAETARHGTVFSLCLPREGSHLRANGMNAA